AMQSINLTTDEIQLIADFLVSGGGEPPPRPTDGPGLYGMFCAACHGADGRGGSAIGVTGTPLPMIVDGIANIPAMQGIDMTNEELQKVADFLTNGGSGDIPAGGQGLYDVFCAVCHGTDWQGRKFFGITGASEPMINAAIRDIQWMQPLNHLDNNQIQLIAQYLGAGGPAPLPTDAQGLYGVFCEVCHGAGGHGDKFKAVTGASSEFISSAITDEPWMNTLQLTNTQLQQIAGYLSAGGEPPLPADGESLYGVFCAVCHGAGGHGGKFEAVTGASDPMIAEAINEVPWMDELTLTGTQRQAIADFLGSGGTPPLPSSGAELYNVFCSVCHGDGGHGGKFFAVTGAPASMINNAINNEPWMNGIDASSSQINLIAQFLTTGGDGPLPQDGQGLYGVLCSVCHGADGRGGIYKVVTGTNQSFINRALNNVGLMNPLQINATQVAAITDFLAAGGGGSKPTTGSGLYHVYCETCHGPNGSGGPEENVRGESAGGISSAINDESAMRQLRPYLTSNDISAIAGFLGGSSGGGN
ncbi:MAG: c-type cytochrome, partial [Gammaproteobacteria bacterium]